MGDDRAKRHHQTQQADLARADAMRKLAEQLDPFVGTGEFDGRRKAGLAEIARLDATPAADAGLAERECEDFFALADRRANGLETPVPLPWPSIAPMYGGGFWPGVHVVGGGTKSGKTQWALQVAYHAARQGHPVTYIALELGKSDIMARLCALAAAEAGITDGGRRIFASRLLHGRHEPEGAYSARLRDELRQALTMQLAGRPLYLRTASAHSMDYDRLADEARALRDRHPLGKDGKVGLVVLDFLQLVSAPESVKADLRQAITKATYRLTGVAEPLGLACLSISSTSREWAKRLGMWGDCYPAAGFTVAKKKKGSRSDLEDGGDEADDANILLTCGAFEGSGKESGDIEYSVTTQTVLARVRKGEHLGTVRVARPLARNGRGAQHSALEFDGSVFQEIEDPDRVGIFDEHEAASRREFTFAPAKGRSRPSGKVPARQPGFDGYLQTDGHERYQRPPTPAEVRQAAPRVRRSFEDT